MSTNTCDWQNVILHKALDAWHGPIYFSGIFNPFYPEASADELQPVPDHFLKSLCQHYKMTGLHLKWT